MPQLTQKVNGTHVQGNTNRFELETAQCSSVRRMRVQGCSGMDSSLPGKACGAASQPSGDLNGMLGLCPACARQACRMHICRWRCSVSRLCQPNMHLLRTLPILQQVCAEGLPLPPPQHNSADGFHCNSHSSVHSPTLVTSLHTSLGLHLLSISTMPAEAAGI